MPGLRCEVARVEGGMATLEHRALLTSDEHPLARAAFAARRAVLPGQVVGPGVAFPAWTDGALLSAFAQVPVVVLGPGELADAHSPRESIEVAELETAARLYARLALEFCVPQ
jgi:acetylornithine deacetylase/succinyl-diaminopimelate desuccinylase-like protein